MILLKRIVSGEMFEGDCSDKYTIKCVKRVHTWEWGPPLKWVESFKSNRMIARMDDFELVSNNVKDIT